MICSQNTKLAAAIEQTYSCAKNSSFLGTDSVELIFVFEKRNLLELDPFCRCLAELSLETKEDNYRAVEPCF